MRDTRCVARWGVVHEPANVCNAIQSPSLYQCERIAGWRSLALEKVCWRGGRLPGFPAYIPNGQRVEDQQPEQPQDIHRQQ
jgi:hypothetical protein